MTSGFWCMCCVVMAACGPVGGEATVASQQRSEQQGLVLRARALQDRVADPDSVMLVLTIVNPTKEEQVFIDHAPFLSYEVRRADSVAVQPVEGDIVLASGANPITILPGDSVQRAVNLACIGLDLKPEYKPGRENCLLRFDLSERGTYHIVVTYRAPQPPLDPQQEEFVELRSNRVLLQN